MNVGFLLLAVLFAKEMSKIYTVYISKLLQGHIKKLQSEQFIHFKVFFGILPLMGISQTASGNIIVL